MNKKKLVTGMLGLAMSVSLIVSGCSSNGNNKAAKENNAGEAANA